MWDSKKENFEYYRFWTFLTKTYEVQDCKKYIEIGNNVLIRFNKDSNGNMTELPKKSIDQGMGLERIASVVQGKHNNFDTDLFQDLIANSVNMFGGQDNVLAHRVIADHLRATSFLIADGVLPSNEGRGYILRRLLRRAIGCINQLGTKNVSMFRLVPKLVDLMGSHYTELKEKEDFIMSTMEDEEKRFRQTLDRGMKILNEEIEKYCKENNLK